MLTPEETFEKFKKKEIKFIPPQLYELGRLHKFKNLEELAEFSMERQKYGVHAFLPKYTKDLKLGVLPGKFI